MHDNVTVEIIMFQSMNIIMDIINILLPMPLYAWSYIDNVRTESHGLLNCQF